LLGEFFRFPAGTGLPVHIHLVLKTSVVIEYAVHRVNRIDGGANPKYADHMVKRMEASR